MGHPTFQPIIKKADGFPTSHCSAQYDRVLILQLFDLDKEFAKEKDF